MDRDELPHVIVKHVYIEKRYFLAVLPWKSPDRYINESETDRAPDFSHFHPHNSQRWE
jgi:hypothetical protein